MGMSTEFSSNIYGHHPKQNQQILRSINNGMFNKRLKITIHGDILGVMENNGK